MSGLRALFLCDGGPAVGGGHLMRALTLAGALAERGWRSTFLTTPFADGVLDRYDRNGCERLAVVEASPASLKEAALAAGPFSACVVDHFGISRDEESRLRAVAPLLAAIDDLPGRRRDLDLVADANLGDRLADWARSAPGAEALVGPAYALVRPEFAGARSAALERRRSAWRNDRLATRVLVSLGLTDVGGATARAVEAILPSALWTRVDVVVGREAPSWKRLAALAERDPRLALHSYLDASRLAELMAAADIALGAGGGSTWERCTVGLPTVTVILADNQAPGALARAAASKQAVIDARVAGWERHLREELEFRACDEWIAEAEGDARLCDGLGAGRVADRLTARAQPGARQ